MKERQLSLSLLIPKRIQRGLRVITLQEAIKKSPILLSDYWKNEWLIGTIIISYFAGSNYIFADCISMTKEPNQKIETVCTCHNGYMSNISNRVQYHSFLKNQISPMDIFVLDKYWKHNRRNHIYFWTRLVQS